MKRERKPKRAFPTMARRITALVFTLWLLAMGLLTWAEAVHMQVQVAQNLRDMVSGGDRIIPNGDDLPADLPGSMEVGMIENLGDPYLWLYSFVEPLLPTTVEFNGVGSDDWMWGRWDLYFGFEAAAAYHQDEALLMDSGDYMTFTYTTQENWMGEELEAMGRGYVDLDALTTTDFSDFVDTWPMGDFGVFMLWDAVRMTGYFDGGRFHPMTMGWGDTAYGSPVSLPQMSKLDRGGKLVWNPILTEPAVTDRELVTIYAWDFSGIRHDAGPVTVDGVYYDSLEALASGDRENWGRYDSSSLLESVFIARDTKSDQYGEYTYTVAVRCWPLQYAALRLIPSYLVTLAVTALLLWLLLWSIRRNLTRPLVELGDKICRNAPINPGAAWAEPRALEEYYGTSRQALHEADTRIAQLDTALAYARTAEESRRQLVSNITHELKTPLAVIHSYAEGLQAGIAEEKRERYLAVILEEAERMDAMVLQMLDLSRLEAGRVRLGSDTFSLLALARSVAEKLTPLAAEKEQVFRWNLAQDFSVTADEARMEQVLTNLMGNAVKYAPAGGKIEIQVFAHDGAAHFRIENPAPHLPAEALEKVWDSFYRADPSRSEPGTGLGLTIVRTIVELHRGTCSVRNTTIRENGESRTGVEFGFQIPL